jgi:hypothetical protein
MVEQCTAGNGAANCLVTAAQAAGIFCDHDEDPPPPAAVMSASGRG